MDGKDKDFLTEQMVLSLKKSDSYYANRWLYYKEVIDELKMMKNIEKILELGPYKSPLVRGEDVMDISSDYIMHSPNPINKFIRHNCMVTPYPIEDKSYDLIIACQVLEHLGMDGQQVSIFNEFERISNKVLITLPYNWFSPRNRSHHGITRRMIDSWASLRKPIFEKIMGDDDDDYKRILRIYEF